MPSAASGAAQGRVGFYVWDYAGGGVEFMRAFWTAAIALDPADAQLGTKLPGLAAVLA